MTIHKTPQKNPVKLRKDDMEKEEFWEGYAVNVLANPNATEYECKTAIIGVSSFSEELTHQLKEKKCRRVKY